MKIEVKAPVEAIKTFKTDELKCGHAYVVVKGDSYWVGHVVVAGINEVVFLDGNYRVGAYLNKSQDSVFYIYRELFEGEEVVISK